MTMRDAYLRIIGAIQSGNRFRREDVVALAEERTRYREALWAIDTSLDRASSDGPLTMPEQIVRDLARAALSGRKQPGQ